MSTYSYDSNFIHAAELAIERYQGSLDTAKAATKITIQSNIDSLVHRLSLMLQPELLETFEVAKSGDTYTFNLHGACSYSPAKIELKIYTTTYDNGNRVMKHWGVKGFDRGFTGEDSMIIYQPYFELLYKLQLALRNAEFDNFLALCFVKEERCVDLEQYYYTEIRKSSVELRKIKEAAEQEAKEAEQAERLEGLGDIFEVGREWNIRKNRFIAFSRPSGDTFKVFKVTKARVYLHRFVEDIGYQRFEMRIPRNVWAEVAADYGSPCCAFIPGLKFSPL